MEPIGADCSYTQCAAQLTTFGKRLAMFGEDLFCAVRELDRIIDNYPVRGLKAPWAHRWI